MNIKRLFLLMICSVSMIACNKVNPSTPDVSGTDVEKEEEIFTNSDSESTDSTEWESSVEQSQIYINMAERRIEIPPRYMLSICKNLQVGKEKVYDKDMMAAISEDINNSEIIQISIDGENVIQKEELGELFQYPILFETARKDDYVAVNLLSRQESDFYVQLMLTVPSDNLINVDNFSLEDSIGGKRYINCFVKSEKLYRDIELFWGPKMTIDDIQNPEKIVLFYNDSYSRPIGETSEEKVIFSEKDAGKFVQELSDNAFKVYDDHSFGITVAISTRDNKDVNIYYADDGCSMFQFEGESYNLDPNGAASTIIRKYIEKLEQ